MFLKIFKNYFAQQYWDIKSNCTSILYRTDTSLVKIDFATDDIANIIKSLVSSKSDRIDNIRIFMIKFSGTSVYESLEIAFRTF